MSTPNLAGLCGAVAIAFNLDVERVTATATIVKGGALIVVLVDGKSPSPDVAAFVNGMFDGARKLAAMGANE